jgi:hypothetical protein
LLLHVEQRVCRSDLPVAMPTDETRPPPPSFDREHSRREVICRADSAEFGS